MSIEYRKATAQEAEIVCNIVQGTKAAIYPHYIFYEHRGYKTVEHKKYDIGDGEVMVYEIMRKER